MIEDIIALVRTALLADPVLAAYGTPPKVVQIVGEGVRLKTNPTPPYIRVGAKVSHLNGVIEAALVTVWVASPDLATREALYKRIRLTLHKKRLAKDGLLVLRLLEMDTTDNLPDRVTGGVLRQVVYRSRVVIDPKVYG